MNSISRRYLILIDPVEDILTLQETALSCFYSGDVVTLTKPERYPEMLKQRGHPEVVIVSPEIIKNGFQSLTVPIVVVDRPVTAESFSQSVKEHTLHEFLHPQFIPVKTEHLLKMGVGLFDLFLKLSETNFVKIIHKGEAFFEADEKKLIQKGIKELYLRIEDSREFLNYLEKEITWAKTQSTGDITLVLDNIEAFERIARHLKWTPEVIQSAQKTVTEAVKILSKNEKVLQTIKQKLQRSSSSYSHHIGLLSYLVCSFSSSLGWVGESGQTKLALAALMHDLAVEEDIYEDMDHWNKRACDSSDKNTDSIKYRMHPYEASKLIASMDSFPPDVDQIILQHHETKDGMGFPRGLDSGRIGQLPAIFIIVEDLVEFVGNGENLETSITDFIMWGDAYYDSGHFKKIFQTFRKKIA